MSRGLLLRIGPLSSELYCLAAGSAARLPAKNPIKPCTHGSRRLLGNLEEEARAHPCLGQRGARPGLSHRRAGEPMKPPVHDASARQSSGEPFSGFSANDARRDRPHNQDLAKVDGEIARLVDRSTQELRRAWQRLYHTGSPLGLSRDLIIRGLADKLQQRAHGGPSRIAAPPSDFDGRVRERRWFFRRGRRAEDRRELGAAVARTYPYRPRRRGRVRI